MFNILSLEFPLGLVTNLTALYLLTVLGIYSLRTFPIQDHQIRPFYLLFLTSFAEVVVHLSTVALQKAHFLGDNQLGVVMYSLVFAVDSLYIAAWIAYLNNRLYRLRRANKDYRIRMGVVSAPVLVLLVLSIANISTPVFFSYENFSYQRQPLYELTLLIPLCYLTWGFIWFLRSKIKQRVYREVPFCQLLLPIVVAHVLERVFFGLCVIPLSHVITFLILVLNNEKIRVSRDSLTSLYTRASFFEYLGTAARLKRGDSRIAGIMLDLDRFKSVNDDFGHLEGDRALADFGRILGNSLPYNAIGFRYAGDEFVIILEHSNAAEAYQVAGKVMRGVAHLNESGKRPYKLAASFGIATWQEGDTAQSFVARMDGNLYADKAL